MPSIRIKAPNYLALQDTHATPTQRRRPSNSFFSSNTSPRDALDPLSPRTQRSLPTLRGERPSEEPRPPARPRSGTVRSQIHAYRTNSSRPHARGADLEREPSGRPPSLPLSNRPITLEGSQAGVIVPSTGGHGVIGSTLSLAGSEHSVDEHLLPDGHDDDVVEHLDVIDPQVGTVSSLTNAANALLIPPLSFYSRKPILILKGVPPTVFDPALGDEKKHILDSLDRHVDDVLRRPSKFKRTMKGVWSFLTTPMGVITGIYGFLVVFWGAAIIIFVAKIINFHNPNTQGFWVEVASQVENGLFTATGIGLIPYRVFDTYRIFWIWYYKRKTRELRTKAGLPPLFDEDDLPDPIYDPNYVHVLTAKEEKFLYRQQRKFRYSQTWYRPHGTETHRAFPINTALLICLLNDGNSIFQIMLCGTMWGLDRYAPSKAYRLVDNFLRFQRPAWSTGTLIPCSFLCGILAAVFIWRGGQRTKRVAEVEKRLRAALLTESEKQQIKNTDPRCGLGNQESELVIDEHMVVPPRAHFA